MVTLVVYRLRMGLVRKGYNQMSGPKILVVDDSWTELTLIVAPLRNSGFEVITAVDGDEAIEKVFKERPQCIVLDVVLPKQNGFQVCRKLKSLEFSRKIPIILLTSKSTEVDKNWGMRQGADLYLTKPFREDELLAGVRRLI
jgi:twitching motility two-component system response regulator PilH